MCENVNNCICTVINCVVDACIACSHYVLTISSCPNHNGNEVGHFNNEQNEESDDARQRDQAHNFDWTGQAIRTRKRKLNQKDWKRNKTRYLRNTGESYWSKVGDNILVIPKRQCKPIQCLKNKCP